MSLEQELSSQTKVEITENQENNFPLVEENLEEVYDYTIFSKDQLIAEIKTIKAEKAISVSKTQLSDLKTAFDEVFNQERQTALDNFLETGGEKDDFSYQDAKAKVFYDLVKDLGEIRKKHKQQQEEQRIANTKKKKQLLDQLRALVDGEESSATFNQIKEIQKTWKESGSVASADFYELNASYHALLNRYYSFRSIYFDLKNLDRDKNLLQKKALLAQVNALLDTPNTLEAVKQLGDLHAQYKNLGPVPEEVSESLWNDFKEATNKVRERREQFLTEQEQKFEQNAMLKTQVISKINHYSTIEASSIKEWKSLTEELNEIQKEWKKIGLVPEAKKKEINDAFWAIVRGFYENKSKYFTSLDADKKQNHQQKLALIAKVAEIKDSEDFRNTAEKIKQIQNEWKQIGQSPKEVHESVYQEFRSLCDHFFNRRTESFDAKEKEFVINLEKKKDLCKQISQLKKAEDKAKFETLVAEFFAVGMVPKAEVSNTQKEFLTVTQAYIAGLSDLPEDEIQKLKITVELGAVKGTQGEREFIQNKSRTLRNKIGALQEEIGTLNNNVEFFANSKNIASIREEVSKKVAELEKEVNKIKEQLKLLRTYEA
jgi:hypothetical protein